MKSTTDLKVEEYEASKNLDVLIAYSDENGHKGYYIAPICDPDFWLNHLPTLNEAIEHANSFQWNISYPSEGREFSQ